MSGCCRGLPAKVCIARPYGCADEPPDPHPVGAYDPETGEKLAIIGCPCRFCFDRMLDGPGRRRMTR